MLEPRGGELTLTALHPGGIVEQAREATGWQLCVADELTEARPPTRREPAAPEELLAR